jgi:asparagine synthase (glutamine-hydrolysing)
MCGIAGIIHREPGSHRKLIEQITRRIAHRGPDADGFWPADPQAVSSAWLGHRRLSIIDLAAGIQPMPNEDQSSWIIYNGEVFNHSDLRPALEAAGHRYRSHCDTETIVHSLEQHGPAGLSQFRGMFSFAIWDQHKQELFCARDRLGIKPFYYYFDGNHFVFASEIKALLAHPAVRVQPDLSALPEYLAFGFRSEQDATLFQGIRALPPGHWLRVKVNLGEALHLEMQRYWDAPAPAQSTPMEETAAVEETYRRFEETVHMRLMSDVPLGMFLSGGVDSSAIAAMIRRITGGPLKTFSVGYTEQKFSELPWAKQVAEHIGSEHSEVLVSGGDFFQALPDLVWQEDEPIAWPSSVSLYFVSKLAAQQVKVVLTGEGSDEIFAGYGRYRYFLEFSKHAQIWEKSPEFFRSGVRNFIANSSLLGASTRRKLSHTVLGRPGGFTSLYLDNFLAAFSRRDLDRLLQHSGDPYAGYLAHYEHFRNGPPLQRLLYADQKTYLTELLRKQDRMSMACSIESRVPLLDHTLVEFAASLPSNLKLRGPTGKYVFKRMAERLLPSSIVHREKMGFPTPVSDWMSGAFRPPVEALLSDRNSFCSQFLNAQATSDLLAKSRSGQHDTTDRVWRWLMLEIWGRRFFMGQNPSLV